jgi:Na+/H+ antiporter NhaC
MMLFIDDYLNILTVGNVMKSVTDKFHIPRVKLAYLVATMAAPLVILLPISTWIGFIMGQLNASGISLETINRPIVLTDPFFIYLSFIPFIFYSFMIIASNWIIVTKKLSFGPMKEQETIASQSGNLFGGKNAQNSELIIEKEKNSSLLDFLLPILTFVGIIFIGVPYSGDFYLYGGSNSLTQAFQKANAPLVLFLSSIISLIISIVFAFGRKKINLKEIPEIFVHGVKLMYLSILMIFFAWIFGGFLKELQTGRYIAQLLMGSINIKLIPFMIFVTSMIITLAIGATWGAIAIMMPIVTAIFPPLLNLTLPASIENLFILIPSLGAIFSGALAGNHLSPISDSTIMSSACTGAYIIDLVKCRFWYVLSPIMATGISYLITGLLINQNIYVILLASIGSGIILTFIFLEIIQSIFKNR